MQKAIVIFQKIKQELKILRRHKNFSSALFIIHICHRTPGLPVLSLSFFAAKQTSQNTLFGRMLSFLFDLLCLQRKKSAVRMQVFKTFNYLRFVALLCFPFFQLKCLQEEARL